MTNHSLVDDYRRRAHGRRATAIPALMAGALYADVVRECQEATELALKSMIRAAGHAVPHTHDVSDTLRAIESDLESDARACLARLVGISRDLRRDRELSFYGSEDLTPSTFYQHADAARAIAMLDEVLEVIPRPAGP